MKRVLTAIIICSLMFVSCTAGGTEISDTTEKRVVTTSATEETTPITEYHIETVSYPVFDNIYGYEALNASEKALFDTFSKIITMDVDADDGIYQPIPVSQTFTGAEYLTVRDIFTANFGVFSNLLLFVVPNSTKGDEDSYDSLRAQADCKGEIDAERERFFAVREKAAEILPKISFDGTEISKVRAIADYIIDNTEYMYDFREMPDATPETAYSALLFGDAICSGYSEAFNLLCKMAGVNTICVTNYGDRTNAGEIEWHEWNMVVLDGEWYHIDTTWMDSEENDYYFMMNDTLSENVHEYASCFYDCLKKEPTAPRATSLKYYPYYRESCDAALKAFSESVFEDLSKTYVCFENETEAERFATLKGNIIKDKNGTEFYLNIRENCEIDFTVTFVKVR